AFRPFAAEKPPEGGTTNPDTVPWGTDAKTLVGPARLATMRCRLHSEEAHHVYVSSAPASRGPYGTRSSGRPHRNPDPGPVRQVPPTGRRRDQNGLQTRAATRRPRLHHRQHPGRSHAARRLARNLPAQPLPRPRPRHPQPRLLRRRTDAPPALAVVRHP